MGMWMVMNLNIGLFRVKKFPMNAHSVFREYWAFGQSLSDFILSYCSVNDNHLTCCLVKYVVIKYKN